MDQKLQSNSHKKRPKKNSNHHFAWWRSSTELLLMNVFLQVKAVCRSLIATFKPCVDLKWRRCNCVVSIFNPIHQDDAVSAPFSLKQQNCNKDPPALFLKHMLLACLMGRSHADKLLFIVNGRRESWGKLQLMQMSFDNVKSLTLHLGMMCKLEGWYCVVGDRGLLRIGQWIGNLKQVYLIMYRL